MENKTIKKAIQEMNDSVQSEIVKDALCKAVEYHGYRCQVSQEDGQYYLWIDIPPKESNRGSTTMTALIDIVRTSPNGIFAKIKSMGRIFSVVARKDGKLSGEGEFLKALDKKIRG